MPLVKDNFVVNREYSRAEALQYKLNYKHYKVTWITTRVDGKEK